MADLKISQLTGATTPLAGTEVLPIVQSSSTKKVSIADLTAGRAVSAGSLALTSAPLPVASGGTGLSSYTLYGVVYASGTGTLATNSSFKYSGTQVSINTSTTDIGKLTIDTTAQTGIDIFRSDSSANYGALRLRNQANSANYGTVGFDSLGLRLDGDAGRIVLSSSGVERFHVDSSGNLVPQAAAKGVNFTANTPAAGKTSQLLNWYEEGTWTPAIRFNGGNTGMTVTASGKYTRLGRQVTVTLSFTFTAKGSSTGQFEARGLPFNAGTPGSGVMGYNLLWATMPTGGVSWTASGDRIYAIAANNGAYMDDTYFNNNTIVSDITVTYFV